MLKILVVEDSAIHQQAARLQLAGHNLTIVATCQEAQSQLKEAWDVVLTDMMIPWTDGCEEMPLGMTLVMLALKSGVKKIALVTDANHHENLNSRALDVFRSVDPRKGEWRKGFVVGDSEVIVTNGGGRTADATTLQILSSEDLYSEEGKVKYPLTGGPYNSKFGNTTRIKCWAEVLKVLTS